jgi:hypothetical protein
MAASVACPRALMQKGFAVRDRAMQRQLPGYCSVFRIKAQGHLIPRGHRDSEVQRWIGCGPGL